MPMTILNSAPGPSLSSRAAAHGDSDDDFEDATDLMDDDDAIFLPEKSSSRRIQPLIPDDFGSDDTMAAIRFSEEFANRYGQPHPSFFPGSLDDAIRESCSQPAKNVSIHFKTMLWKTRFCQRNSTI